MNQPTAPSRRRWIGTLALGILVGAIGGGAGGAAARDSVAVETENAFRTQIADCRYEVASLHKVVGLQDDAFTFLAEADLVSALNSRATAGEYLKLLEEKGAC